MKRYDEDYERDVYDLFVENDPCEEKTLDTRALPFLWPARRNIENTQTFAGLASWIFFGARECSGRRAQDRFDRYSADKGLAGAYNHNIVKLEEEILARPGIHKLFIVGELGRHYFAKRDVQIDTNFQYTVQNPTMHRARDIAAVLLDQFRERELDEIYIVYTRMENSVQAEAEVMKLLPLERSSFNEMKMPLNVHREAIALYPSAEAVMDSIIPNYVTGIVYGALVEAYASEHNARMMAMKSATDSAKSLIHDLSIIYNRARQAAITQEITEVCSGARGTAKIEMQQKKAGADTSGRSVYQTGGRMPL